MVRRIVYILVILGLVLSGCSRATISSKSTTIPMGELTPYHTLTPRPISPTSTLVMAIPVKPAPTPTPFLHTITNDDTMLGIAYQYGITLEELQAANPGVDPHYLTVGKQLIIPISGEIPEILPTPTAIPVHVEDPTCYRTGDGGAWCIVAVSNDLGMSVENLSVWIELFTGQGEMITGQVAFAPLNILRPGSTIPLMAYFSPPLPDQFDVRSEIMSGLGVSADDTRYLDLQVIIGDEVMSPDRKQDSVSGRIVVGGTTLAPSQVWVLVVAYDSAGKIIGVRKWESEGQTEFNISVYSLRGEIERVEVLAEARP